METLKELREKYDSLCKEQCTLYEKIVKLEQQEVHNNFVVGECYLNTFCCSFKKIVAIDKDILHCIVITNGNIQRDYYCLMSTKYWKKITSEQFMNVYLAVMTDIQDPDFEAGKESNFNIVLKSIYDSINKEK